jgi:DNA-binding NarL/FixJ family response regulator
LVGFLTATPVLKILIVDDEQLDLFITKKLLSLEFEVEGFTDAQDTLNWAQQHPFDVVLIDYYLGPGVYPHIVLKELIALKGNSFKAFVLSNHVDDQQARELKEAGFEAIIYKPLTLEKFKDHVNG